MKRVFGWFDTRPGMVAMAVAAFVLAYVFISFAIDSGSLLDYAITLVLLVIGIRELTLAILRKGRK